MTEEDTFNRLRRISWREMHKIYINYPAPVIDIESIFTEHGWTFSEFIDAISVTRLHNSHACEA